MSTTEKKKQQQEEQEEQPPPEDNYLYGLKPPEAVVKGHASRRAAEHCRYMLPRLQQMVADKPQRKILDVGCGPGSITLDLARCVPEGQVVGLDLSASVIEKAREAAADQGIRNVEFVQGDVYRLPFEDGSFDVVHAHQAIAHFHEHVRAIRELVRVTTKDSGMVCMREADLHTARFYPEMPLLAESWQLAVALFRSRGQETAPGLKLKVWTVRAGVPREAITATASAWCYNTPEGRAEYGVSWAGRLKEGKFPEDVLRLGLATREQLDDYAEAWRQWTANEDGMFCLTQGEVIAVIT